MIRLIALWLVLIAAAVLLLILREERLSAAGKVPLGRLRRLWLPRDRRRAPRYRVDWAVRYRRSESQPASAALGRVAAPPLAPAEARARDLSRTGAGLSLTEKLPVGTLLQLDVTLPSSASPLSLTGQVVWAREIPASEAADTERRFFVGVHFHNLDPALERELSDVLAGRLTSSSARSAARYAQCRRLAWVAEVALSLGFLSAVVCSRIDERWAGWVGQHLRTWPLQVALYAAGLWAAWTAMSFPLDWAVGFRMERRFQLSTQRFPQWLGDYLKQLAVGGALGLVVVEGLSLLLRVSPAAWWVWAALLWMAWSVLLTRVAPTWLIPLFYRQRPLEEGPLRTRLQELLERCGTRVHGIFEVNLSRTTRKANACLCGLSKSRRVLISDTLLSRYPAEEVEVVLAHELGHHRMRHIGILILVSGLSAGLSCYGVDRWLREYGSRMGLSGLQDLAAQPLIALGLILASLALLPITQGISRWLEAQADRFALEQTRNPTAFIATLLRLAKQNLAELQPPRWVEWLLYDHPPIAKRIAMAERFGAENG